VSTLVAMARVNRITLVGKSLLIRRNLPDPKRVYQSTTLKKYSAEHTILTNISLLS
jgi:hypothetical protein